VVPYMLRVGRRTAVLAVLALFLPIGMASAQEQDSFRYWSYWWGGADGTWSYAQTGPVDRPVTDGDVEGWLFLTSAEAVPSQQPGLAPDFAALCPDGEPIPGQVRVGVVIDFGTERDVPAGDAIPEGENPQGQCITVPQGSTAEDVLGAAADVRSEQGAVCGIAGYPATGCFEVVSAEEAAVAAADAEESSGFPAWPIAAGFAVVAAIIVLLLARARSKTAA
jgi:hypothetical protein